jgi:uncharacterized membrane protein
MIKKLHHWWQEKRSSFWFVPAVMVLDAVVLATVLIMVDATAGLQIVERWPLLFGAGAAGARGLLTAVAGSMITVAGVVFSITLVAISLTSSQYTSRVIRNFMRNRVNQVVLGVFVGIAFLIYFIHHISMSIQASNIIASAAQETLSAVDHLFPKGLDEDAKKFGTDEDTDGTPAMSPMNQSWFAIPARKTGYIESIEMNALLDAARKHGTVLRMERCIGEFVVEGTPLVSVSGPFDADDRTTAGINELYIISRQRTVEQDPAFGIRQIVDIALKALSPGINDTTTAVICVDYLSAILIRLAPRRIAASHLMDQGELRVIVRGPSFGSLLAEAFDQIRQNAEGNVAVMSRMLEVLQTIAGLTAGPIRRRAVREQVQCIAESADRTLVSPHDRAGFENCLERTHGMRQIRAGLQGES